MKLASFQSKTIKNNGNVGKSGSLLLNDVVMIFQVAPKQEVMESSNDYGYLDASAEVMEETEDSLDSSLSN